MTTRDQCERCGAEMYQCRCEMMIEYPLFAPVRRTDPETSWAAWHDKVLPGLTEGRSRVCMALHKFNAGLTSHELADYLREDISCVSPRLKPMERLGIIRRDGTRMGDKGCKRTVWKLAVVR